MTPGRPPTPGSADEPPHRPQVWHPYRMGHSINTAWLGYSISIVQIDALDDAWDLLVVHDEWRDWKRAHLIPASPFLYLAVRDGIGKRRLQKTRTGVSMHLPASELARAEANHELVPLYLSVLRDIYAKWSQKSGCPAPPPLPPMP